MDNRVILLTSQRLDSSLIPLELACQVGYLTLMPFGVEEIPEMKDEQDLSSVCWYGGYPRMVYPSKSWSNAQFSQYVNTYIEQDVRQLKSIVDTSQFLSFLKECARRVGELLNLTAIAKVCGIAVNTARSWLSVLETGYIVYRLPPYQEGFGHRVVKAPKLYFCDTGLLCYLLGIKRPEDIAVHGQYGAIVENFMMNDLHRLFHHRGQSDTPIYYWRDHRGFEITCLIPHEGILRGIDFQSCRSVSDVEFETMSRWKELSKSRLMENYIVYCGEPVKRGQDPWVLSWKEMLSSTNGILIRDTVEFYKQDTKKKKK